MTVYLNDRLWLGLKGCVETCDCCEPSASVIVYAKPGLCWQDSWTKKSVERRRELVSCLVAETCGFRIAVGCWLRGGEKCLMVPVPVPVDIVEEILWIENLFKIPPVLRYGSAVPDRYLNRSNCTKAGC